MQIKFLFFFCLIGIVLLGGCDKDETEVLDPEGDIFRAYIDGELFNAESAQGTFIAVLFLSGTKSNAELMNLDLFPAAMNEGTYSLGVSSQIAFQYYTGTGSIENHYAATSGSCTVTKHDADEKRITGTFNFECDNGLGDSISITDGFFDIKYN